MIEQHPDAIIRKLTTEELEQLKDEWQYEQINIRCGVDAQPITMLIDHIVLLEKELAELISKDGAQ